MTVEASTVMRAARHLRAPVAVLLLAAACGGDSTAPRGWSPLSIVAGANAADTVTATPLQALVVQVRDAHGVPVRGVAVHFAPLPGNDSLGRGYAAIEVGPLSGDWFIPFEIVDSSDANGRAKVLVQFGQLVGPAAIAVTVPALGLADTARYTVKPGNAAHILMRVRDTALYAGSLYAIAARSTDRFLNPRPADTLTYTALSGNISVTSDGVVGATSVGRASIVVRAGSASDTARVSVLPHGVLVYLQQKSPIGVAMINLDGSGYKFLLSNSDLSAYPQWSPDGQSIVMYGGNPWGGSRVALLAMDGNYRFPVQTPVDSLAGAGFPRFAPDGTIYFGGYSSSGALAVWQVHTDGSALREIPNTRGTDFQQPAVSPDGRTLLYDHGPNNSIVALDLASGATTTIGTGTFPVYSPDGTKIAYVSNGAVVVADASGANAHAITGPVGMADWWAPSWTADGQWVLPPRNPLTLVRVSDGATMPLPIPGVYQGALR